MNTQGRMFQVLVALIPGLSTTVYAYGIGSLINVAVMILLCVLLEWLVCNFRGLPPRNAADGSVMVTGALLGLALPPLLPFVPLVIAAIFAVIVAKHFYGGLGQNLFNPAMVGFAVLIVSYPMAMTTWVQVDWSTAIAMKFHAEAIDGISSATPLDLFRNNDPLTMSEYWQLEQLDWAAWAWINMAYLAGGIYLLARRVCDWRAPVGMLAAMLALSVLFYDSGSSGGIGSPLFHLFSGATMMAAFFIVTDPVTSPNSATGQWLFGIGVGALVILIRSVGAYPDGVAFAILLMNAASPLIDQVQRQVLAEKQA